MSTKKLIGFAVLVIIFAGLVWAAEEFQWEYPGQQAYVGTPEQAIKKLPLPAEVQAAFLEMIKRSESDGVIRKRDRLDAMVFGSGELKTNVVAAWKDDNQIEIKAEEWTMVFGGKEYVLKRPLVCNNWSVAVKPVGGIISTPPPTKPAEYILSGSPAPYHTIAIWLWSSGNLAAVSGQQSRDLGAQLRAAAREGRLQPYPGHFVFRVEFRDLDFASAEGKILCINNKPFTLSNFTGNTIAVPVENGQGYLSLPVDMAGKDTALVIHSPWFKPDIKYPPSGSLKTCAKSTAGICGSVAKEGEPSEFYQLATTTGESNYHFIK